MRSGSPIGTCIKIYWSRWLFTIWTYQIYVPDTMHLYMPQDYNKNEKYDGDIWYIPSHGETVINKAQIIILINLVPIFTRDDLVIRVYKLDLKVFFFFSIIVCIIAFSLWNTNHMIIFIWIEDEIVRWENPRLWRRWFQFKKSIKAQ